MAKLDPIVSEFETEEAAEAYDKWFRAQVEAGMQDTGPDVPHEQVMSEVREMLKAKRHARRTLAQ